MLYQLQIVSSEIFITIHAKRYRQPYFAITANMNELQNTKSPNNQIEIG